MKWLGRKRKDPLLGEVSRVRESGLNGGKGQTGIALNDLLRRGSLRQIRQHHRHRNARPANARFPMSDCRINGYVILPAHIVSLRANPLSPFYHRFLMREESAAEAYEFRQLKIVFRVIRPPATYLELGVAFTVAYVINRWQ